MSESFTGDGGLRLSYRRAGTGPPLVCHPGGPGYSSRYFGEDIGGLGERLELLMLNPRGSEGSDRPRDRSAYQIDDYVADLEAFRVHLGLERLTLLGHSHGGIVAMAYAAAHPERVDRLLLASTAPRFAEEQEEAMQSAMAARAEEPWYEDARDAVEREEAGDYDGDDELADLVAREFPFYFADWDDDARAYVETIHDELPTSDALKLFNDEILRTFDLRPALAGIEAPTLVITGAEDFITGPAGAHEIGAAMPAAETVILPETGHFVFVESPGSFRETVWRFLGVGP